MPDISMCPSSTCLVRLRCYRHADSGTKPGWRQSWFADPPGDDGTCPAFMEKWKWKKAEKEAGE